MIKSLICVISLMRGSAIAAEKPASTCYGTPARGKLENGIALPTHGINFRAYSRLADILDRNYVHDKIHRVVLSAYEHLHREHRDLKFVYGETGKQNGGRFKPHRTHQNGLSVDFMVPVFDTSRKPVFLPTSVFNKYGYAYEFNVEGRADDLKIDFAAVAVHLIALKSAADNEGVSVRQVIFDRPYVEALRKTNAWKQHSPNMPIANFKPWIRHDEHYHIDFGVPCRPFQ